MQPHRSCLLLLLLLLLLLVPLHLQPLMLVVLLPPMLRCQLPRLLLLPAARRTALLARAAAGKVRRVPRHGAARRRGRRLLPRGRLLLQLMKVFEHVEVRQLLGRAQRAADVLLCGCRRDWMV